VLRCRNQVSGTHNELDGDDLELVLRFIDALVTKTRLKNLAAEAS